MHYVYEQFVIENEDKRKRAAEKLANDEASLEIKLQEEQEFQKELQEMESLCSDVEQMLEKYSIYEVRKKQSCADVFIPKVNNIHIS